MKIILCFLLFPLFLCIPVYAQENNSMGEDSLEVSLLTCSPGTQIYQYYGHTALLVRDFHSGHEYVFNYGLFSFTSSYFIWRFLLGECDYLCGVTDLESFLDNYRMRQTGVREDVLNLSQEECFRLFEALKLNCLPENATYRYNFFYDNCATRIRDQIENCIDGDVMYSGHIADKSLRDIVHEYSKPYAWSLFGQDLLLGAEADWYASREHQEFSPVCLQHDIGEAFIKDSSGSVRPLVLRSDSLLSDGVIAYEKGFPLSPFACCMTLFVLTLIVSGWDIYRAKPCWVYDLVMLGLQGLAGLLVTFMFLFSQHPTVDSNWLVLLFNPLPLFLLYWIIGKEIRHKRSLYHAVARIYLFVFICATYWIPQYISVEVKILALCLLLRSMSNHIIYEYRIRK